MKPTTMLSAVMVIMSLAIFTESKAIEKQFVYGAGPSTKIVELFFTEFEKSPSCNGYSFTIPPKSVKHAGGIKASDKYLFGRTGRPLNSKEKALNKNEIFLAQVPISIAVGSGAGITSLTLEQLENIVTGKITNWKEVGGADAQIINTGREGKEALYSILKHRYPFYNAAKFSKIFNKDHEVVSFLSNPMGKHAIAFGAAPNFKEVNGIIILTVDNYSAGQDLGLVCDRSNLNHPIVKAVKEFSQSNKWVQALHANGYNVPGR